jgi:hypothetical protein
MMGGLFFAAGALACVGSFILGTLWRRDHRQTSEASTAEHSPVAGLSPADAYILRAARDARRI